MNTVAVQLEGLGIENLCSCHCWMGYGVQTGSDCGEEMGTGWDPGLELGL